ncbi:MAG: hypothetical protein H0V44_17325 [Planctomycetes bacterium]|nr:hypothetical protein [Planctomycetota bacterium]
MPRHNVIQVIIPVLAVLLAGCGGDSRPTAAAGDGAKAVPGSYSDGGGLSRYYGEELHEKRIYVFGTKDMHNAFKATHTVDPTKSKSFIGEGPNRETVVVQAEKDQPAMTARLLESFKKRYALK